MEFTERILAGVDSVTKRPGETEEEYKARVMANVDGMKVKRADLRHNSDIRRLKNKVPTDKDIARTIKYQEFYLQIEAKLTVLGEL